MKQSWNDVYLKEESSKSLRRTRQTALSSQVLVLDFGCISKSREFERRFLGAKDLPDVEQSRAEQRPLITLYTTRRSLKTIR